MLTRGVIPTSMVEKPCEAFQPCWWGVLTKRKKEGKKEEPVKDKKETETKDKDGKKETAKAEDKK